MTPNPPWRCPTLTTGSPVASITARQADVLACLCMGLTSHQIARRLETSESSVRKLTSRLIASLGARDRCNAVALVASGQLILHVKGGTA